MGKVWLYIKPHVFVAESGKDEMVLLYNTKSGDHLKVEDGEIIEIIHKLHERVNLGSILIDESELESSKRKDFIEGVKMKDICGLLPQAEGVSHPIQLMPILNIQRDVEKIKKDQDRSFGEGILDYLSELNIFINEKCNVDCSLCGSGYKQFHCCNKLGSQNNMSVEVLQTIEKQLRYSSLGRINILGGDIFEYPYLNDLRELFADYKNILHYWVYYKNFVFDSSIEITDVLVDFPVDEEVLWSCIHKISQDKVTYHFAVSDINDVNQVDSLIAKFSISDSKIHPFFNGINLDFFKQCVFLTEDDILSDLISQRQIFCNQAVNSNDFGSLYVMPDGLVYANLNTNALGNVKEDSLLSLIYKELDINTSWRKIRDCEPCNRCIYQFLCPPISNYELFMDKFNLCLVKE